MWAECPLWPQGAGDQAYARSLGFKGLVIDRKLESLIRIFETEEVDYIGTRLHAGILALEHNIKTLIISVDNRAREMGKDLGLPVIARETIADLADEFDAVSEFELDVQQDATRKFKESICA